LQEAVNTVNQSIKITSILGLLSYRSNYWIDFELFIYLFLFTYLFQCFFDTILISTTCRRTKILCHNKSTTTATTFPL